MQHPHLQLQEGGNHMSRRLTVELEVLDEVLVNLPEEEASAKAKEAFIMELLREHRVSQGKAAEMLVLTRHELFALMTKYQVPVIDLTPEELKAELAQPFPHTSGEPRS
jgi:DNA-binding NtrC family response regulator